MTNQNQKGISSLLGIIVVIVIGVIAIGGVLAYQYWWAPEKEAEVETPKDETADWRIYRNEEYGFEMKYPLKDWEVEELKEANPRILVVSKVWRPDMPEGGSFPDIIIRDISLDDFISEYNQESELFCGSGKGISKIEDFVLGGVAAKKLTACTAIGLDFNYIFVEKNDKSYIIKYQDYDSIHRQMLSTFRFIE